MAEHSKHKTPATYHPMVELTRTRILEFLREKEALFWTFGFPIIMALVLGIAFRSKPPDLPRLAVSGRGVMVQRVLQQFLAQKWPVSHLTMAEAEQRLRRGHLDLLIEIAESKVGEGDGISLSALTYRYDLTRPEGRIAFLEAERVLQGRAKQSDSGSREDNTPLPGSRYIDFLIPGLIGLNLMSSGMWGVGFSVTLARMNKLLKRLAATPMRRSHYLLSFILSRLILLIPEMVVLILASWLLFSVGVRGHVLDLVFIALLGAFTFAGIGLLTACRARTIESISGWMNLVMLPMWVLSGSFFSYERFPEGLHGVVRALPLTALNDALRMVMIDGLPLTAAWTEVLVLGIWCIVCFILALRFFRWQ